MLQMLQEKLFILVNITINNGKCLVDSLKFLVKIGSLALFEVI